MEIWKDIPGYEGSYQVSDLGRVRSLDRIVLCKQGVSKLYKGKELKQRRDGVSGHMKVRLGGGGFCWFTHRLVLLAFEGPCPDGLMTRHMDGDPTNNKWPSNITYGTRAENHRDRVLHGECRVSSFGIRVVRRLRGILLQKEIATIFSVRRDHVSRIQRKVDYSHV